MVNNYCYTQKVSSFLHFTSKLLLLFCFLVLCSNCTGKGVTNMGSEIGHTGLNSAFVLLWGWEESWVRYLAR